jgi:hypothetical protein
MDDETRSESSTQRVGEVHAASGWTTTKQAAKVLGVSRRSVQSYVRRGLLEARDEGEGVNKRFLVSIDSLNALSERRRREAAETTKFAEASAEAESAANAGETLRHAIDRLEARTEEATELRIRLELTERAESTLREELADERRRRERAEQEREDLRRELVVLREARESSESADSSGPSESPTPTGGEAQEAAQSAHSATLRPQGNEARGRPWWRRILGG